jgi:hypothetical protein
LADDTCLDHTFHQPDILVDRSISKTQLYLLNKECVTGYATSHSFSSAVEAGPAIVKPPHQHEKGEKNTYIPENKFDMMGTQSPDPDSVLGQCGR